MKDKTKDKIILLQYLAFTITILILVLTNINNSFLWIMLLYSAILFFSLYLKNAFFYSLNKKLALCMFLPDLILVFMIIHYDRGTSAGIFLFILISDITINFRISYGIILSLICYTGYVVYLKFLYEEAELIVLFWEAVKSFVQYVIICSFLFVLKYILKQNETINDTLKKLTEKTLEQEMTFYELKEAYHKLEDITILKERNKLAREIHDTLGHTLTTVLVEIEAGKILLEKDNGLGIEKLDMAADQLRKGMGDLRSSVSMLSKGDELVDFKASIEAFINDTQRNTGTIIEYDIVLEEEIDASIRKTIFRALQEGITNGIKHGKSTVFVFRLYSNNGNIEFLLQDNGKGCSAVIQGFGLKSMRERVKEASGFIKYISEPSEGFTLSITIPIKKGDERSGKN